MSIVIEQVSKEELIGAARWEERPEEIRIMSTPTEDDKLYYGYRNDMDSDLNVHSFENVNDCLKYLEGKIEIPSAEWDAYNKYKKTDPTLLYYTDYIRSKELYQ